MNCRESYLNKHKMDKTQMKMFLTNGAMLSGKIVHFDEDSVVLDECLANWDHICSLTPNRDKK